MGIDESRIVVNISKYGNTTDATIPLCLPRRSRGGESTPKGDYLVMAALAPDLRGKRPAAGGGKQVTGMSMNADSVNLGIKSKIWIEDSEGAVVFGGRTALISWRLLPGAGRFMPHRSSK